MGNYNNKNKNRSCSNRKPIEKRSESIETIIVNQLYGNELELVTSSLFYFIDLSTININLNNGLVITFDSKLKRDAVKSLRKALDDAFICYKLNNRQELVFSNEKVYRDKKR